MSRRIIDEEAAYHEAGHAVMAYLFGISTIAIQGGTTEIVGASTWFGRGEIDKVKSEQSYLINLAGIAATVIRYGGTDNDKAMRCAMDFKDLAGQSESEMIVLCQQAFALLTSNWQKVESVATALIGHRYIGKTRIARLLRTPPPKGVKQHG